MDKNHVQNKIVGAYVAGVFQCVCGSIFAVSFGGTVIAATASYMGGLAAAMLILCLASVVLILRGAWNCRAASHTRRILNVMSGKNRENLSVLAQVINKDYSGLVRSLRDLARRGFFPGAYVDLYRREFVLRGGGYVPPVTPGTTVLREVQVKPVLPIYCIGLTWLLYGMLFPFYRWGDYLIAAVVSLVVYVVVGRALPKRSEIIEEARPEPPAPEPDPINTGNKELDEVLQAAMDYMNELTMLDSAITSGNIDMQVKELVKISKQIFDYIKKTPSKVKQIRQFMNYYLPTTIKLLKNYDELNREPYKGENIRMAMDKIENTMQTIVNAFQKELDDLYQDKALDISVDIEVMQNMMEQEGLSGDIATEAKRDSQ